MKAYKSKKTAALLAILLGFLGAHRFYLGQWRGVFYIPFVIYSLLLAWIEAAVFLTCDQVKWDEKYNEGKTADEVARELASIRVASTVVFPPSRHRAIELSSTVAQSHAYTGEGGPNLSLLSNARFFKWFLLINLGIVITSGWIGGIGFILPFIGFAGAFLSLIFAKWLAIRAHDIHVIDPNQTLSVAEEYLYGIVAELAGKAKLPVSPEVGIYDSPDMNAFATGMSRSNSLVAFSTALLEKMSPNQIRAVAAHEIAHISNQDMLAMVLLQGLLNSIVLACILPLQGIRIVNWFSDQFSVAIEFFLWLVKTLLATVLTLFGGLFLKAFSRGREYRADAFAAALVGKEHMAAALQTIAGETETAPAGQLSYNAFKISSSASFWELFSTHPDMHKRIQALHDNTYLK
ncbi:MAG: M48 family metalloprotease [Gallionella sp.]|nr:M48 family metalloprotease [Gallionella sp.]